MKRFITLLVLGILTVTNIYSQKKKLTLRDAVVNYKLYGDYIYGLKWRTGTSDYTYLADDFVTLMKSGAKSKKSEKFLTLQDLLKYTGDSIKRFPSYEWLDANTLKFKADTVIYVVDLKAKKHLKAKFVLTSDAENIFYDKNANAVAFTIKNNLYLLKADGKKIQITNWPKGIVSGQIVSRNEFGIDHGIFWSPKGNYIAFYRKDERNVTDYPIVDITKRVAEVDPVKYPMAGMSSEIVWLCVYDLKTGKTIYIENGNSDQYLTAVTWGPQEKFIYIGVLNREQNHLWLNKYDVTTGKKVKTLFEETNDRYVEPENPLFFVPGHSGEFLWLSRRDGYRHFYLYNTDGKLIRQVTKGNWEVTGFVGFDAKGENVIFTAASPTPIENRIYKAELASGKISEVSKGEGTHHAVYFDGSKYVIDRYSNVNTPTIYQIVDLNGKVVKTIKKSSNPKDEYVFGKMKIFKLKADDGSDLYSRIIYPPDFDSTKKYPVLVYVYGGPHVQLITNSWLGGAQLWLYYMAQEGYIVFTLDNHGSANRGFAFESIVHRHLGQQEMKDQMKGIEYLQSLPYVDTSRIGVDGWSFGGFMTTSLMVNYPKVFKVGVAGGPVIDWKYYEVMYGERYMDKPQENPEGYKETSLLNDDKIKTLKGRKFMIIHGALDHTVVWQHSLLFIRKCIEDGVQVDYFVYPRAHHNVRGYDRIHLLEKITDYFNTFLRDRN